MAETTLSPSYYKRGSIQVWDFIRDQELSFHLGNVIKYVCRAGHKKDKITDLEKAIVYLQNELTHAKRQDLSGHNSPDQVVFGGTGLPGGLSPDTISFNSSSVSSKELDYGGIQGVFGGGGATLFN